jgi:hypothetical protein
MSRKSGIIVIAIVAILILNNLHIFGTSGFGAFVDLSLTIVIISRAVVLVKRINRNRVPLSANPWIRSAQRVTSMRKEPPVSIIPPPSAAGIHPAWVLALITLFLMICFGYHILAAAGLNFFVWGDHLFGAGAPPIIMWILAGLFLGGVTGTIVFWRKYHTEFKWCLVAIIPFLLVLILLQTLSDPLQSFSPRPIAVVVDSSKQNEIISEPVVITKRKKHKAAKLITKTDTSSVDNQVALKNPDCTKQLAGISINARSDSVNVYYRTASYQNGPWGEWKSKFIPQQGQFSLTDEGLVKANGLQYYYECKSVLTRSAQNPYTRLLCEGQLVIDTY